MSSGEFPAQHTERMQRLIIKEATAWFVAQQAGPLSDAQREQFSAWLRRSQIHVSEYLALQGIAHDLPRAAARVLTSKQDLVAGAIEQDNVVAFAGPVAQVRVKDVRGSTESSPRWRVAAWLTAACVVVLLSSVILRQPQTRFSTAHAEQRTWRMSDGSIVHLNSDSVLHIKFTDRVREVELVRGQALFQVAKNPARPFWVNAGATRVEAVGTEFDVYRNSRGTVVSVLEGKVAVWRGDVADSSKPMTRLEAGQQARIEHGSAVVSSRSDTVQKTVAWLQREIVFDHDPLGQAVDEFNRYNQLRIRIDNAALRALEISGNFNAYDSESFLRFIERQPGVRIDKDGDDILVSASVEKN
jgi:transmembrane sensor